MWSTVSNMAKRHSLLSFFILACILSWWMRIWYALDPVNVPLGLLILPLGPLLAALVMLALIDGWAGVKSFLGRIVQWRVGLPGDRFVIDAKSGVSGAGATPSPGTHFARVDGSVRPYRIGTHQRSLRRTAVGEGHRAVGLQRRAGQVAGEPLARGDDEDEQAAGHHAHQHRGQLPAELGGKDTLGPPRYRRRRQLHRREGRPREGRDPRQRIRGRGHHRALVPRGESPAFP